MGILLRTSKPTRDHPNKIAVITISKIKALTNLPFIIVNKDFRVNGYANTPINKPYCCFLFILYEESEEAFKFKNDEEI